METLSSEISFHCVICFDEFSVRDRPPVVLPCGHTYVCLVCSKRLKRCMECREPLFWTPPSSQKVAPFPNTRSPAPLRYNAPRGRYSPAPQTPPQPIPSLTKEEPVPLPLPRNLVLLGVIEAAHEQERLLKEAREAEGNIIDDSDSEGEDDEESTLARGLAGMTSLTGACGTYAVREPEGLAVLPFDPNRQHKKEESLEEEKKNEEPREPFTIAFGHTVQVVGVDEGVYKLARGMGYIVATVNQLVKGACPFRKTRFSPLDASHLHLEYSWWSIREVLSA